MTRPHMRLLSTSTFDENGYGLHAENAGPHQGFLKMEHC